MADTTRLETTSHHHGEATISIEFDGKVVFRMKVVGELTGETIPPPNQNLFG